MKFILTFWSFKFFERTRIILIHVYNTHVVLNIIKYSMDLVAEAATGLRVGVTFVSL